MNNVLENKVSCLANFYDNEPIGRALKDIVGLATSEAVKKLTLDIRHLRSIANNSNTPIVQALDAKKKADNLKKNLPSFLTDVYCEHGKKRSDISSFQPFIGFDVDHITEQDTEALMELLKADPHIPIAEPSCSRTGVHFIVLIDAADWLNQMWDGKDIDPYKYVWNLAKDYVEGTYNVDVDVKCMNPEHIFGICFDELVHYKENPEPLHIDTNAYVPVCAKPSAKSNNHQAPCGSYHASMSEVENRIKKMLQSSGSTFTSGNRNNYVHRFALLCNDFGVDQSEAESYCQSYFVDSDFTATEVARTVNSAYSNTSAHGTLGLTVSATSAIPSSMGNSRNSENSAIFSTFDSNTDTGGLAEVAESIAALPTFSDKINFEEMPGILKKICETQQDAVHRDKMTLGSLTMFGGMMGYANYYEGERAGIYGIYSGSCVYAPFYTVIYGNASSGKGDVKYCSYLASEIRQEVVGSYKAEMEEYQERLSQWEAENKGKNKSGTPAPKEPEYRDIMIPGNSSSAAYTLHIHANGGAGISVETEGDTISAMLNSDFGNYSDLWRKAFHHEPISISRRTEKLHVEIEDPRLAILITETPGQVASMFSSSWENGLGSRFIFYYLPNDKLEFRDVFAHQDRTFEDIYKDLGREFTPLYHALQGRKGHPLQFVFSKEQQHTFLNYFNELLHEKFAQLGNGIEAVVFRFGLILFRISMVLTALRRLDKPRSYDEPIFDDNENALVCDTLDFKIAMTIVETLIEHSARVFSVLNKELDNPFATQGIQLSQEEIKLYNALPDSEFETKDFIATAAAIKIPTRTAERMLGEMTSKKQIIVRIRRGVYAKVETKKS